MPIYFLLVTTRPTTGLEAEYHRWYDRVHLAEVLGVPGFIHAQRFQVEPRYSAAQAETEFLAIYTILSDDIDVTLAKFDEARDSMKSPCSLQAEYVSFQLLRSITQL